MDTKKLRTNLDQKPESNTPHENTNQELTGIQEFTKEKTRSVFLNWTNMEKEYEDFFNKIPKRNGYLDLINFKKIGEGGSHDIYQHPDFPEYVIKLAQEYLNFSGREPDQTDQEYMLKEVTSLNEQYQKVYSHFGAENCQPELRKMSKFVISHDGQNFPMLGVLSVQKYSEVFENPDHIDFSTVYLERNNQHLQPENLDIYINLNRALLANGDFQEADFLTNNRKAPSLWEKLNSDADFIEAVKDFLLKFKAYFSETGNFLDFVGQKNVLFYRQEGKWKFQMGSVIKGERLEVLEQIMNLLNEKPERISQDPRLLNQLRNHLALIRFVNALGLKTGLGKIIDPQFSDLQLTNLLKVDFNHKAKPKVIEHEITPEEKVIADKIILESLGLATQEEIKNFSDLLFREVRALPKYLQIEKKLDGLEKSQVPFQLYHLLRKADECHIQYDANLPQDGVLIRSMSHGILKCAGRTLIASAVLEKFGIKHSKVDAPGHAFLLIQIDEDTLAYFDAHNNLYFTFPMNALQNFQDHEMTSECYLRNYSARSKDLVDGDSIPYTHFVVTPSLEGNGRTYLSNLAAALRGRPEFAMSNFPVDQKVRDAVIAFRTSYYGHNQILENYKNCPSSGYHDLDLQDVSKESLENLFTKSKDLADFTKYLSINPKLLSSSRPYFNNLTEEGKKKLMKKLWQMLKKKELS